MNLLTIPGLGLPGPACMLAIAVLSLLLRPVPRHRALAGGLVVGLALASQHVAGMAEGPSLSSVAISSGILVFGVVLALSQAAMALQERGQPGPVATAVVAGSAIVVGLAAGLIRPMIHAGGWATMLETVGGLVAGGALLDRLGKLGKVEAMLIPRQSPAGLGLDLRPVRGIVGLHLIGLLGMLVAPHLHVFMAALFGGLAAGVVLERRMRGKSGWPLSLMPGLLALLLAWVLLTRVAGDQSLRLTELINAPYSLSFEMLAALLLGLVAWSLLGLWPWSASALGPMTPVLGGTLLVRLVIPVLPEGLQHWQPVLYPLVALAAWHAAVTRREDESLIALGALGLLSGDQNAGWAGLVLVAGGVASRLAERMTVGPTGWRAGALWILLPVGAVLVLPVLSGALPAQTFYSTLTVAGVSVALWRGCFCPEHLS